MIVPRPDIDIIRQSAALFLPAGCVAELRIPKAGKDGTISGYFSDQEKFARAALSLDAKAAPGIYVTLNPVAPALLGRADNRIEKRAQKTTSDADVTRRCWLLIDLDPVRPSGISSNETEHRAALDRAVTVRAARRAAGWPNPVYADSGNGGHLDYPIDLPNDAAATALIKGALHALATLHDDAAVAIDQAVFNAGRILKAYGTVARKGDPTLDRPHRLATILEMPDELVPVTAEQLAALAAHAAKTKALPTRATFDVGQWLSKHGLSHHAPVPYEGGLKWILRCCPFNPEHGADSAVFQNPHGTCAFFCFHNGCAGKNWAGLRELLDPPGTLVAARSATNVAELAEEITSAHNFARDEGGQVFVYRNGVYQRGGDRVIRQEVKLQMTGWGLAEKWTSSRANEVVEFISVDAPELWSQPPADVVNVSNGLLNVLTRQLSPHHASFLSAVRLPVEFDPAATCPACTKFVAEVFPEDSNILAWQIVALCMTPWNDIQKAVLLIGPGSDGKSTFLSFLGTFLGEENTAAISLHDLDGNRFSSSGLLGKLANIYADLPKTKMADTSIFKGATGGDSITAERKFGQPFKFRPFAKFVFSANKAPRSDDSSNAFYRRFLVIPFSKSFAEGAAGTALRSVLDASLSTPTELSGAMNLALDALPQLRENGFLQSRSTQEALIDFRDTTDPLPIFLVSETVSHPDAYVAQGELIAAFNRSQSNAGRPCFSSKAFGDALKKARPDVDGTGQKTINGVRVHIYTGIGLRRAENGNFHFGPVQ